MSEKKLTTPPPCDTSKATTPPLRGTPPFQEGSCKNSPPDKGEYPEGGRGLNNLPVLRTFRKELRSHLTPAEAKLWTYLQRSQLGKRKIRRQHSVGYYILNFYCPAERLVIEDSEEAPKHENVMVTGESLKIRRCCVAIGSSI